MSTIRDAMKTLEHVKRQDAIKHTNASTCSVYEYPTKNAEISIGVAEITGRYPEQGFAMNRICNEMGFILKGTGKLVTEAQSIDLSPGDVVCIPTGEKFYWEGNLTIVLPTTPAWDPQQHEMIHPSQEINRQ